MTPKQFDPGDDDRGTPDHRVKRLQGLFLAEPLAPLDQELKVGLDGTEIDVLGIPPWQGWVVIVWHSVPDSLAAAKLQFRGAMLLRREAWRQIPDDG